MKIKFESNQNLSITLFESNQNLSITLCPDQKKYLISISGISNSILNRLEKKLYLRLLLRERKDNLPIYIVQEKLGIKNREKAISILSLVHKISEKEKQQMESENEQYQLLLV